MMNVNNKKVVRRLSNRMLKQNKTRNIVSVVAIFLTTFMLISLFLFGINAYRFNEMTWIQYSGTSADAHLTNPTSEQMSMLKKDPNVDKIGENITAAKYEDKDTSIELSYSSAEAYNWKKDAFVSIKGSYPTEKDEILLSKGTLAHLGIEEPSIGMSIKLPGSENEFRLSGWFKEHVNDEHADLFYGIGFVSKEFLKSTGQTLERHGYVDIQFTKGINAPEQVDLMKDNMKLSENQLFTEYFSFSNDNDQVMILVAIAIVLLLVMFSGYLLIYNVFYLSVSHDIRSFGLLKTIGTTSKQIRRIVVRQAFLLAGVGIPIGVVLGISLAASFSLYANMPNFFRDWPIQLALVVVSILFALLTVFISVWKPAKVVGKISPVEAARYVESSKSRKKNKEYLSINGGKVSKMAFRNIFRHEKRAFIVLLSLFFGIAIFLCVFTIVKSMNIENYVNTAYSSDFQIENSYTQNAQGEFELYYDISDEIPERIADIEDVTAVISQYVANYETEFTDAFSSYYDWVKEDYSKENLRKQFSGEVIGLTGEGLEKLLPEKSAKQFNLTEFEQENIVYLSKSRIGQYDLPNKFTIKNSETGVELDVQFGGYVDTVMRGTGLDAGAPALIASKNLVDKLSGRSDLPIANLFVNVKENSEKKVAQELNELLSDNNTLHVDSKQSFRENLQLSILAISLVGGGFSLILALIGVVNFINIMFTSIHARKPELSILEGIGMTKKQIKKMVMLEGVYYGGISLAFVWTIGNGIAYGLYRMFKNTATYAIYEFPFIPLLTVSIIVMVICMVVPLLTYKRISKESITERLRAGY